MTANISQEHPLILASGSKYRAGLLARLRVPFAALPSGVHETRIPGETPEDMVKRLAHAKARSLSHRFPDRWILGSDQAAVCNDRVLGKPGTRERAVEQLALLSGQSAKFYTAVVLVRGVGARSYETADVTTVRFRNLERPEIERYVDAENVLDCAGSFKSEGLGISLCASVMSHDPTALVGLPLIAVRQLLMQAGLAIP